MARVMARSGVPAGSELQALANDLAQRLGAARSRVLLHVYDRPLALTCGLFRPTVLLSTWMVEHLDRRELEAVVAPEMGPAAPRGPLGGPVGTVRPDCFFLQSTNGAS